MLKDLKATPQRLWFLFTLLLLVMALPARVNAYADPGPGALVYQIALTALIAMAVGLRRAVIWIRADGRLHSGRSLGLLFASCYAVVTSPIICGVYLTQPFPRFNDIFLIGIVLTAYLFTWEGAAYLLAISLLVSAWVLPPYGSLAISRMQDWYRVFSFSAISVFLIVLVHRLKNRPASSSGRDSTQSEFSTQMASGD